MYINIDKRWYYLFCSLTSPNYIKNVLHITVYYQIYEYEMLIFSFSKNMLNSEEW